MISTPTTAITAASLMAAGTLEARQANARSFTFTLPTGSTFNGHAAVYLELRENGVLGEDGLLARVSEANPTGTSVTLTLSIEQMNQPVIGDSKEFGLWLYVDEHQLIYEGLLTLYADETAHSLTDDPPAVTEINLTRTLADTLYKPIDAASGGEWGAITGTLSDQTDLQGVLTSIDQTLGSAVSEIADASNQFVAESSKLVRWGVDGEIHAGSITQNGEFVLDTSNIGVSGGVAAYDATQTALGTKVTVDGDAGTPSAIVLTNATFPSSIVTLTGSQTLTNKSIAASQLTGDVAVARIATALTAPGAIGGTTPGTGAFTTSTATTSYTVTATGTGGPTFKVNNGFGMGQDHLNTGMVLGNVAGAAVWIRSGALISFQASAVIGFVNAGWSGSIDAAFSRNAAGVIEINNGTAGTFRDLRARSVIQQPPASITPSSNGDLVFEATSNTSLTVKLKGTDGTVRSVVLTLA